MWFSTNLFWSFCCFTKTLNLSFSTPNNSRHMITGVWGIVITEYPAFRFYSYFKLKLHILKILHYESSKLVWVPQELANFKTIHFLFLSFIKDCMQISRLFEALPHGKYKNMRRKSNTTQFTRLLVITAINKCEFGRGKKSIHQLSHWFLSKKVTLCVIYAIINTAFFFFFHY